MSQVAESAPSNSQGPDYWEFMGIIYMKVQGDGIFNLQTWDKVADAPENRFTNIIVAWSVVQCMTSVFSVCSRTPWKVAGGSDVGAGLGQSLLGDQGVVHQLE